jgi:hypothetical protein
VKPAHAVATVVLVASTPVVAWWAIGDVSEDVSPAAAYYAFRPPSLSARAELMLGAGSTTGALAALVVLVPATRRGAVAVRWWGVVAPLVGLGVFAGFAYRVMTAAVHGANIGAGLVVLLAPFAATGALATAAWQLRSWASLSRRPRVGDAQDMGP